MKIAIVNDTILVVETLRRIILKVPNYQLAWVAYDGAQAVAKCATDTPDLILMDVLMPKMDGLEATRYIMSQSPCAILMVTASVNRYAAKVFAAMGYGALDAVNIPALELHSSASGEAKILQKIATIARLISKSPQQPSHIRKKPSSPLIVIGASTGGPLALATILSQWTQNLTAPVVIVQHLDAQFAPNFVAWLNEQVTLPVEIATVGCTLEPGKVLVANCVHHLVMHPNQTLCYQKEPSNALYCPSVDVFFQSVATHWQGKGIGILLSGMGRDGAQGLKALQDAGWYTIAQDQKTSTVYGMPKAAVELGAATNTLPLDAIASACRNYLGSKIIQ